MIVDCNTQSVNLGENTILQIVITVIHIRRQSSVSSTTQIIIILFISFSSVVVLWGKIYKGENNAMSEIFTKFSTGIKKHFNRAGLKPVSL